MRDEAYKSCTGIFPAGLGKVTFTWDGEHEAHLELENWNFYGDAGPVQLPDALVALCKLILQKQEIYPDLHKKKIFK